MTQTCIQQPNWKQHWMRWLLRGDEVRVQKMQKVAIACFSCVETHEWLCTAFKTCWNLPVCFTARWQILSLVFPVYFYCLPLSIFIYLCLFVQNPTQLWEDITLCMPLLSNFSPGACWFGRGCVWWWCRSSDFHIETMCLCEKPLEYHHQREVCRRCAPVEWF